MISATNLGAQLSGKDKKNFETIQGELLLRAGAAPGTRTDAEVLASIDLANFYRADTEDARLATLKAFLESRGVQPPWELQRSLYKALDDFPPMAHLINLTMSEAQPVDILGARVFEGVD